MLCKTNYLQCKCTPWLICPTHRAFVYDNAYKWGQLQQERYGIATLTNYKLSVADGHFNYFVAKFGALKVVAGVVVSLLMKYSDIRNTSQREGK